MPVTKQQFAPVKIYTGETITVREIRVRCSELKNVVGPAYKRFLNPLTDEEQEKYDKWKEAGKTELVTFIKLQEKLDKGKDLSVSSTVVNTFYNKYILGIDSFFGNQATQRGTNQEQDSIDLLNSVYNCKYTKHEGRETNEYITGEPDIKTVKAIGDIKTRATWDTFEKRTSQDDIDDHMWQLWGYGQLFGKKQGVIINTLPSYDPKWIETQLNYLTNPSAVSQTRRFYNFDRIDPASRVKMTYINLDIVDAKLVYKILDKFYAQLNDMIQYKPKIV